MGFCRIKLIPTFAHCSPLQGGECLLLTSKFCLIMETGVQKCESANIDEFAIVELEERLEMTAAAVDAEGYIEPSITIGVNKEDGAYIRGTVKWYF